MWEWVLIGLGTSALIEAVRRAWIGWHFLRHVDTLREDETRKIRRMMGRQLSELWVSPEIQRRVIDLWEDRIRQRMGELEPDLQVDRDASTRQFVLSAVFMGLAALLISAAGIVIALN